MVEIDLLPEKIRSAEKLKVIVLLGSASLVLPVLFWSWQFTGKRALLKAVEAEIAKVNAELNSPSLRHVVEEVEKFTRDRQELETKRSVVDVLRKRHATYVRLLDVLPDLVPLRVRLTSLELSDVKGTKKVKTQGEARSPEAMAEYYANLEVHPVIRKVAMEAPPRMKKTPSGELVEFIISFEVEDFQ